ncbi:hypothetical protein RND81_12G232100 [Saponaria officinalis]|uniref:DUF4408 domain-containing protein n=1 Tax=Saponaria officinalis TaxID=3572 RepID=A0AAW1HEB0_SAPOF
MEQLSIMKTLLISTGVVSLAVTLKLSLPLTLDILTTTELPHFSWLQPPYLYLIVNCIIISIVASSKLHAGGGGGGPAVERSAAEEFVAAVEKEAVEEVEEVVKEVVFGFVERKEGVDERCGGDAVVEREEKEVFMSPESVAMPVEAVAVVEKPPFSARFGHRKVVKGSPQGKTALKKVTKPKRQETLESTWRTLTEGRSMPLTRHLRKSETFAGATPTASPPAHLMKKSDSFSGSSDAESLSPGSGKLRREPSLSQDDLNRRVEAFIKKFNEEMRLQRQQESLNHYRQPQPKFSYETVLL